MYAAGIGKFHTINAFVKDKINRFQSSEKTFLSVFDFICSEPDNIFCESNDGYRISSVTYREFSLRCARFATVLEDLLADIDYDRTVGIYMDNSEEWLEIFWAILMCGYRPLLMNKRLSDTLTDHVLREAGPALIISDSKTFSIKTVMIGDLCEKVEHAEEMARAHMRWANEIIFISSGTSSHVKLSFYSGENIFWQICDSAHIIRQSRYMKKHWKGRLKLLTFLPFYHIFGLVAVFMWFSFFSRSFVLLNDYSANTILNTIKRHEVTHIFAVPLFWDTVYREANRKIASRGKDTMEKLKKGFAISDKLVKCPILYRMFGTVAYREVRSGMFGNSICFMISGGAAIPTNTLRFFNHIGYHLANGYGMTEIGITSVELSNRPDLLISGSVGLPFYSLEYRIDEKQELFVRGKTLAKAILTDGKRTERVENEWFATHDRAEYVNGRYYILGRSDDMLIGPNGENIDPDRVENELNILHSPARCLIRSAEKDGYGILLISVPRFASQETVDAIRDSAMAELKRLGLTGSVSKICLTFDPLMGPNDFKANRKKLACLYAEESLSDANLPIDTDARFNALTAHVMSVFAGILGKEIEEIGPTDNFFFDLGGSSLDYLSAVMNLQNEFHVGFPTNEGTGLATAKDISAFIEKNAEDM